MRDIVIIILLVLIFFAVFSAKGKYITYKPIEPQTIFDIDQSSAATTGGQEQPVFSYTAEKYDLPVYRIYSDIYLPDKFVGVLTKVKSQADYIIVTEKILEQKLVFVSQPQVAQPQKVALLPKLTTKDLRQLSVTTTESTTNKKVAQPPQVALSPEEGLNYLAVKEFVNKSQKTYYYPGLSTGKDVVVSVVSYTPYSQNEGILKFKVVNNQKSFFFINVFQLETDGQKLPIKVFSEQFVPPEQQIEGYILFPISGAATTNGTATMKGSRYTLTLSDGKNNYRLDFKIP